MEEIRYCTRCISSTARLQSQREHENTGADPGHLHIDEDGVCDACRIAEQQALIDWDARRKELEALCDEHRSSDGSYDCIVPGSGGKDSVFQTRVLKELGMHPLTVTAPPTIPTPWGRRNFEAWVEEFANVTYSPPTRVHRTLTLEALKNLGHPFQPWVIMQQNLGPRAAFDHDVKLVFYGEHFAMHGAGPIADTRTSLRDRAVFTYENLEALRFSGLSLKALREDHDITLSDLNLYMPIKDPGDVQIMYLGYYVPWNVRGNEITASLGGFNPAPERVSGGYQAGSSIDDFIDEAHYHLAALKTPGGLGGRATFQACQDIRAGIIDRDTGLQLAQAFDMEYPKHIAEICEYLRITRAEYDSIAANFRP